MSQQSNTINRQLVGEMLDNCFIVLRTFIEEANHNHDISDSVMSGIRSDFLATLHYFIQQYEFIINITNLQSTRMLKTLLFEIKHYRNEWAHSKDFTLREVHRVADTIQLCFDELYLNRSSPQYKQINGLREQIVVQMSGDIQNY